MRLFRKKSPAAEQTLPLPNHVALIMDGNGRWAQRRGLPRSAGHRAGAENFKKIVRYASSRGIRYLSIYAFSTENWNRPKEEVGTLITLFIQYLDEALRDFVGENIRVLFSGEREPLPPKLQELMGRVEDTSRDKTGMTLIVCLNYGGRCELKDAVRVLARQVRDGALQPDEIEEETISGALYCPEVPDPDVIVRPSGEYRLSNFLLWQSAYSELVFMDVLWPDFTPDRFDEAIAAYQKRNRRFGSLG